MSAVPRLDAPSPALPPALTPLLGREAELDQLLELVESPVNRLVTVTGPGGVGKTRLVLHLARTLIDEFGRDVVFVPLAAITDPDLVLPAIAQALGVETPPGERVEDVIASSLAGRSPLLVLDNLEQVLTAAPAIADLLARSPAATVLATSRAALGIHGEQRAPLAPLPTPPPGQERAQDILQAEAAALFVARARAVRPDLVVDDRAAVVIAEICRRLDGLPLAIELAAARVNILSLQALLARLDNRLQVLGGERRGVPDRLKTMRHAIAWSHDLLAPHEQALFRRLSIFAGGWALDAVEPVYSEVGNGHDALDALGALVDHSLVQILPQASGEPRYAMLETIREYGREQLAEHGEAESASLAHAMHIVELAETAEPELAGSRQGEWLDRLEAEWGNVRLACTWALDAGRPGIVLRILGASWRFGAARGYTTESRALLDRALAATEGEDTADRCRGLLAAGVHAEDQRDLEAARLRLTEARDLAIKLGDRAFEVRALVFLAHEAHDRGDYAAATGANEAAIALATEIDDRRNLASALGAMGNIQYLQGNLDGAADYWERGRQIVAAMGDRRAESAMLGNLGAVASEKGEFARAAEIQEQALELARRVNDLPSIAFGLVNLSEQRRHLGQYDLAEPLLSEGIALLRDLGLRGNEGQGMHMQASLAHARGNSARAAALLQGAVDRFVEIGDHRDLAECADLLVEICIALGVHGPAVELLAAAHTIRENLGVDPAPYKVKELAATSARLRRAMRDAEYDRRWRAGQRLDAAALATRMTGVIHDIGSSETGGGVSAPEPAPARDPLAVLSAREREVLALLVEGRSAREVGEALFISPRTVTTHVNNIYGKLGVSTRAQVVALALRAGFDAR